MDNRREDDRADNARDAARGPIGGEPSEPINAPESAAPRPPQKSAPKRPPRANRPDRPARPAGAKGQAPKTPGPRNSGSRNSGTKNAAPKNPSPKPAPAKKPPGTLRDAIGVWTTRPVAGIHPKYIGRSVVALLTIVVLMLTGFGWSKVNSLSSSVTLLGGLELGDGDGDGAIDILLVGTDSRLDAKGNPLSEEELKWLRVGDEVTTSTDTILLVRIPKDGSTATAVSIPRDAYVEVPGIGKAKINSAYGSTREEVRVREVQSGASEAAAEEAGTKAGRQALISAVGKLTGVTVDHYAEVGLLGFALLTDAVGGVDVCLKQRVREPFSGARFKKGRQTLTGPQALSFVRQRHGLPRGDLDRITRQQVYMASLAQKILSTQTLTSPDKLNELQEAVSRSVLIDDNWDIISFAEQLKDLSGGNVKFTTIPVEDEQAWSDDGTQSVVSVDPPTVRAFVNRLLSKNQTQSTNPRTGITVDVVNAGTVDGLAGNVSGLLGGLGYTKGKIDTHPMNEFDSIVFASSKDNPSAVQLVRDLGGNIEVREDSSLDNEHFRVVLTNTYTGVGSLMQTGQQGPNDQSASNGSSGSTKKVKAPVIKADSDGPLCVN